VFRPVFFKALTNPLLFEADSNPPRDGSLDSSAVPVDPAAAFFARHPEYGVTADVLLVRSLGALNMLTFPVIRIAHGLDIRTDLFLAAVHCSANSFGTAALLEHFYSRPCRSGNGSYPFPRVKRACIYSNLDIPVF
jgi:hypothetical protein